MSRADTYRAAGHWDDATLWRRVESHARRRGDAIAVVDDLGRRSLRYCDLFDAATALARYFRAHGVGPGDVVSVQLPNQWEAAVVALAVQGLGAVVNPLLPGYRIRELTHIFRVARPRAIVTPTVYRGFDHRPLVAEAAAATGVTPHHVVVAPTGEPERASADRRYGAAVAEPVDFADALGDAPGGSEPLGDGRSDAVSELIFTSGTESEPKAVLHSEQTVSFSARTAWRDMQLEESDVVWMPSPVGHSTGFNYGLRMALFHGLPLVLQDRWNTRDALELIESQRCSYTLAATTFLQDLVEAARAEDRDLGSLRCFGCGGAPVPPDLVRAALAVGIGVRRLYGSTEVLVATWNRADAEETKLAETDGTPMSNVEVEVRDDAGAICPVGERGEIFVRGPNTCVGFFEDPGRERRTISADGWVRSGDLGVFDADGHLSIVGRSKDIIIRGGLNIAPREVEDLLVTFPEVERAAVVGVSDPRLGERCCACLVLRPGAVIDLAAVVERLRGLGLATHKLPERLEILDSLPTTASGKIQKFRILERLGEGAA